MNIIKKITISALLSLSVLGLTTSLSALADGASDAALYCSGCHAGLTVNGVVIGGGAKLCPQRTVSEWTTTIDRMNGKGCSVPAGSIAGIASYLAGLGGATLPPITCYDTWGGIVTSYTGTCPTNTTSIPPPTCSSGSPFPDQPFFNGSAWTCIAALICYNSDGSSFGIYSATCPSGTSTTPPPTSASTTTTSTSTTGTNSTAPPTTSTTTTSSTTTTTTGGTLLTCYGYVGAQTGPILTTTAGSCPVGYSTTLPNCQPLNFLNMGSIWVCEGTTTLMRTTTSSTTTTTLCNSYVNGTTQYKYSGSGSCHSFTLDLVTGAHIVRDQKYCQQHMSHFNSSGNHVHAYPHPVCM